MATDVIIRDVSNSDGSDSDIDSDAIMATTKSPPPQRSGIEEFIEEGGIIDTGNITDTEALRDFIASKLEGIRPENIENTPWGKISKAFYQSNKPSAHQIETYQQFMLNDLCEIIYRTIVTYTAKDKEMYRITFSSMTIRKPEIYDYNGVVRELFPYECMVRDYSYTCGIYANIIKTRITNGRATDAIEYDNVHLGNIPCMVGSLFCNLHGKDGDELIRAKECPKNPGGYFIIKGNERVLMSQDRLGHNRVYCYNKCKESIKLPITDKLAGVDDGDCDDECVDDGGGTLPDDALDEPATSTTATVPAAAAVDAEHAYYNVKHRSVQCACYAEVRSFSADHEPNLCTTNLRLSKTNSPQIYVEIVGFKFPMPLKYIFVALGVHDVDTMMNAICCESDGDVRKILAHSFVDNSTNEHIFEYLIKYTVKNNSNRNDITRIVNDKLFHNLSSPVEKICNLGFAAYQLICTYIGRCEENDRDHYGLKRVDSAGPLVANIFKSIWKQTVRNIKTRELEKKPTNTDISQIIKRCQFTAPLIRAFAKGDWSVTKQPKATKQGISQLVNRQNEIAFLSALRRCITPADKNSRLESPRSLHCTHYVFICPSETPEGQTAGLHRNLAALTWISLGGSDVEHAARIFLMSRSYVTLLCELSAITQDVSQHKKIFLNGSWIAMTDEPSRLLDELYVARIQQKFSFDTSIVHSEMGIMIFTDGGRLCVPLIRVRDGRIPHFPDTFVWKDFIECGIIEYVDVNEFETLYISNFPWRLEPEHSHCLIHPSFILGLSAGAIPCSDRNQAPRNVYQAAMGKQALGFMFNFLHRYDTNMNILMYPQKRIVNTEMMRRLDTNSTPAGQNLFIAVVSRGFNQEDSININQCGVDLGMMRSLCYSTYAESGNRRGNSTTHICRPNPVDLRTKKMVGFRSIDSDGTIKPGIPISKRDCVIGKIHQYGSETSEASVKSKKNGKTDNSVVMSNNPDNLSQHIYSMAIEGAAVIDSTIITSNENLYKHVKTRERSIPIPEMGDKFASMHAQKGTNGLMQRREDLPYCAKTGMTPDIFMNPHGFPGRMTMGQPNEAILTLLSVLMGIELDATPFEQHFKTTDICQLLEKLGCDPCGDRQMIDGATGDTMTCKIFVGVNFYQRLKHMVRDKIHARDHNGPRESLTRQPVEGRKYGGGFKMGEMEVWCMISHGAADLLIDRIVTCSDGYELYICNYCGNQANHVSGNTQYSCQYCNQDTSIAKVFIPYAFKLLTQQLNAMGIGIWYSAVRNNAPQQ